MFKQGDQVVFQGDEKAEVQFGPITSMSDQESYLVKWFDDVKHGRSSIVWSVDLERAPKFEVGQEVKFSYDTEILYVTAGPFPSDGDNIWIVKDEKGHHYSSVEEYMVPVVE
jgi:hypothetical protein